MSLAEVHAVLVIAEDSSDTVLVRRSNMDNSISAVQFLGSMGSREAVGSSNGAMVAAPHVLVRGVRYMIYQGTLL